MALRRPSRSKLAGWGAIVAGLGLILTLSGCASLRPVPTPVSAEAQAAQALLERRRAELMDLRSLAEIQIRRGSRTQRLVGVLLLRAPTSSLRFEALAPLGSPVLVVVGDRAAVTVWEVLDDRAYILPASPRATQRWLGLAMGEEELVALLLGCVVPRPNALSVELMPPDDVGPSLALRTADGDQRIWFDPTTGQARKARWTGGSEPAEAVFSVGTADAPLGGATLRTGDGQLEVVVRYKDPVVNAGVDPDLFRLTIPERVRIQDFR